MLSSKMSNEICTIVGEANLAHTERQSSIADLVLSKATSYCFQTTRYITKSNKAKIRLDKPQLQRPCRVHMRLLPEVSAIRFRPNLKHSNVELAEVHYSHHLVCRRVRASSFEAPTSNERQGGNSCRSTDVADERYEVRCQHQQCPRPEVDQLRVPRQLGAPQRQGSLAAPSSILKR